MFTKFFKTSCFSALAILVLMLVFFQSTAISQENKPDTKKLFAEIAGEYEFAEEGQTMLIKFWVEDGKLFGAPEGETPAEIVPVEGEKLLFEVNSPDGMNFRLEFVRGEDKKIAKFILRGAGMEGEGIKIK